MRWHHVLVAVFAAALVGGAPATGRAGWLTLTSGLPGSAGTAATADLWFDFPAGPPAVAVNQLSGTGTIRANAGGGTTHFGGLGVPVLLNLSDGTAYLAGGSPPDGATARTPTGVTPGSAATAAPVSGGTVPSNAALLGITAADRALTVTLTSGAGATLGTATVDVPLGGWWVAGLGPDAKPVAGPIDPPGEPGPVPGGGGGPTDPGGVPGVPEPTTLVLGLIGLGGLALGRRRLAAAGRGPRDRPRAAGDAR